MRDAPAASVDPAALTHAGLETRLHALQKRAFEIYEDAALRAEADPARAEAEYARAEADAAPLIAEARALNDERVHRLRKRARTWRWLAVATALIGAVVVAWLVLRAP